MGVSYNRKANQADFKVAQAPVLNIDDRELEKMLLFDTPGPLRDLPPTLRDVLRNLARLTFRWLIYSVKYNTSPH